MLTAEEKRLMKNINQKLNTIVVKMPLLNSIHEEMQELVHTQEEIHDEIVMSNIAVLSVLADKKSPQLRNKLQQKLKPGVTLKKDHGRISVVHNGGNTGTSCNAVAGSRATAFAIVRNFS